MGTRPKSQVKVWVRFVGETVRVAGPIWLLPSDGVGISGAGRVVWRQSAVSSRSCNNTQACIGL
jgi:hypothetical protein